MGTAWILFALAAQFNCYTGLKLGLRNQVVRILIDRYPGDGPLANKIFGVYSGQNKSFHPPLGSPRGLNHPLARSQRQLYFTYNDKAQLCKQCTV
jgi:hypothetical protein